MNTAGINIARLWLAGFVASLSCVLFLSSAQAASGITYHGRLLKSDLTPVTGTAVEFKIQIRTPGNGNCLMYEETHLKNLSLSDGFFAVGINDSSALHANTEPFGLDRVFQNRGTFNFAPGKCATGSSFQPNPTDGRNIVVEFNDGTFVGWEPLPTQSINFVPMSIETMTVGGFDVESLLRVVDGSGEPVSNLLPMTLTQHNTLLDLVAGTSAVYLNSSSTLNGANLTAGSVTDAKLATGIAGSKISGNITGNAAGFTGSLAGDVTGTQGSNSVVRLQGRNVDTAAPADGQVLKWSTANNRWEPAADVSGGAGGVTSVSSSSPEISVATGTTTPVISVRAGTTAQTGVVRLAASGDSSDSTKVVGAADSRLSDARTPTAHAHPASAITSAAGVYLTYAPNGVVCTDGQVLKWNTAGQHWLCGNDTTGGAGGITDLTGDVTASGTGSVAASIATGAVTSAKILDGTIATADLANTSVTDAKVFDVGVDKITSGTGKYFSYKPNDTGCGNDQTLKWNLSLQRWECANDAVGAGGGLGSLGGQTGSSQTFAVGTTGPFPHIFSGADVHTLNVPLASTASVTSGTISNTDYTTFSAKVGPTRTIATGTGLTGGGDLSTNRTFAVNVGTGANQIPQLDAGGKLLPAVLPSGLVTPSTGPLDDQVLVYDTGTTSWVPTNFGIDDLRTQTGGSQFANGACTASQTLTYSAITDAFTCSNIVVASSNITDGTIVAADLAASIGDGLWTGASGNATRATGSVGIGTATPNATALLDVFSTAKGFLPPRMTQAQRNAIGTPASGLTVYNTDSNELNYYNGAAWTGLGGTSGGQTAWVKIASAVASGPTTSLNVSGLNGNSDGVYRIVSSVTQTGSGSVVYGLSFNNDFGPNYGNKGIFSAGLTAIVEGAVDADGGLLLSTEGAGDVSSTEGLFHVKSGRIRDGLFTFTGDITGEDVEHIGTSGLVWNNTSSNITSLQVTASLSNRIAAGSYVEVWAQRTVGGNGDGDFLKNGSIPLTGNMQMNGNWLSHSGASAGLTVDSSGNVSVGTDTGSQLFNLRKDYDGTSAMSIVNSNATSSAASGLYILNNVGGMGSLLSFSTANSFVEGRNRFRLSSDVNNANGLDLIAAKSTGDMRFMVGGELTANEKMRIEASGNVGIGTLTPNAKLTVQGGMSFSQLASDPTGTASYGSLYAKNDGNLYFRNGTGTVTNLIAGGGSGTVTGITAGTGLTGGTINTSGTIAVDVGTGNNQIVQLIGAGLLPALSGANLTSLNATNIASGTLDAARLPSSLTNGLWAESGGNVSRSGGRVGVGTTGPTAKLEVVGAAVSRTNIITSGATVNLALANNHLLKAPGASTIALQNPVDGGAYTMIIADTTSRTYTFTGCTNSYFSPTNGATTNRSSYTVLVMVDGANTECYITWITGFN